MGQHVEEMNIGDFRAKDVTNDYAESLKHDSITFFDRSEDISNAVCPLCNGTHGSVVHALYGFSILECTCKFMYLFPRPTDEELQDFYQNGRSNMLWHQILEETRGKRKENFRNTMVPLIYKYLGPEYSGKIVDIGCGRGLWLDVLKDTFPKAKLFGVEPFADEDLIKNHSVIKCFLDEMSNHEEFNICSFMSVIEHVRDPIGSLKKSHGILNAGGMVFITAPNMSGFDALSLEPKDRNWEVPQHINFFDLTSINKCVEKAGFNIIESGTFGFLDVDIIKKRGVDLRNDFLNLLMYDEKNDPSRKEFQKFLTNNGMSGQLYVLAAKK